jgi:hypothetical protein
MMKENAFTPDQMAIIFDSLIYTHVMKAKKLKKQRDNFNLSAEINGEAQRDVIITACEDAMYRTSALLKHISDNSEPEVANYIHTGLKSALA